MQRVARAAGALSSRFWAPAARATLTRHQAPSHAWVSTTPHARCMSKLSTFFPRHDDFSDRHIGPNPAAKDDMLEYLGIKVSYTPSLSMFAFHCHPRGTRSRLICTSIFIDVTIYQAVSRVILFVKDGEDPLLKDYFDAKSLSSGPSLSLSHAMAGASDSTCSIDLF